MELILLFIPNKIVAIGTRRCKMRATMSGYYRNLNYDQNKVAKELFDVTKQISSGQKIQYAHDEVSTFIDTVRLDNEVTTLTQIKQNSRKALEFSTNTDSTMTEISKILDAMKVKMVAAGNESNSPQSLNAIAAELRGLEQNLFQLANTSIDGKYLFSGSGVTTQTIDSNGVYQGNNESLKTFIGSGVEQTYNINGNDLFFGDENDTRRYISSNIPMLNKASLFPEFMSEATSAPSIQEYITENDTIRDLIGDVNTIEDLEAGEEDFQKTYFYLRGTNHEGNSFKQRIEMDGSQSVGNLLDKIGAAYGNTALNDLVDVSLNVHGQIEITDKRAGSSKLDFHLVAATDFDTSDGFDDAKVDDLDRLDVGTTSLEAILKEQTTNKLLITEFMNSGLEIASDLRAQVDTITVTDINGTGIVDADDIMSITVGGTPFSFLAGGTLDAALGNIATQIDADPAYNASYVNGSNVVTIAAAVPGTPFTSSFSFADDTVLPVDATPDAYSGVSTTITPNGNAATSIEGLRYDEFNFSREGVTLSANNAQISKVDNAYATPTTKLVDVASGTTIVGSVLDLKGDTIDGLPYDVQVNLSTPGSFVTGSINGVAVNFNIFNVETPRSATPSDEVTYKQLSDIINMVVTDNTPAAAGTNVHPPIPPAVIGVSFTAAEEYDFAVEQASKEGTVDLDHQGKLSFKEERLSVTSTRASISLIDRNASDTFTDNKTSGPTLNFHSNNAITISDAKTDFFGQIDEAITSIELGRLRADGNGSDPRNVGIQNSIQAIDDLSQHLFTQHATAGVNSQTLQTTADRTDLLIITTQTLRSDTLDVDIAEASLELQQLTLNYQAMLSTVSRITQLSLVNYL